jgi:hypothetical protein
MLREMLVRGLAVEKHGDEAPHFSTATRAHSLFLRVGRFQPLLGSFREIVKALPKAG